MIIRLENAAIGSGVGAPLPPLTLTAAPGVPHVVSVETDERPMLVSLLLAGRLRPDSGQVTTDEGTSRDELRRRTALVDTPVVAEPVAGVTLSSVVAEELAFASRPSSRRAVRAFIAEHGLVEYRRLSIRSLPPVERVRLFSELALLRKNIAALILTSPERHGGDPAEWYDTLTGIAGRGVTVVIVTDAVTADILTALGACDATTAPLALTEAAEPDEETATDEAPDLDGAVEPYDTSEPREPKDA